MSNGILHSKFCVFAHVDQQFQVTDLRNLQHIFSVNSENRLNDNNVITENKRVLFKNNRHKDAKRQLVHLYFFISE